MELIKGLARGTCFITTAHFTINAINNDGGPYWPIGAIMVFVIGVTSMLGWMNND